MKYGILFFKLLISLFFTKLSFSQHLSYESFDFESSSGYFLGDFLLPNSNWFVSNGSAIVSNLETQDGFQSVQLSSSGSIPVTEIRRNFTSETSTLFTDFYLRPNLLSFTSDESINIHGAIISFESLGDNKAEIIVYDTNENNELEKLRTGVTFTLTDQKQSTSFLRFTFLLDLSNTKQWSVWLDQTLVASNLNLNHHKSGQVVIFGSDLGPVYLDDFTFSKYPLYFSDFDSDSFSDSYEILNGTNPFDDESKPDTIHYQTGDSIVIEAENYSNTYSGSNNALLNYWEKIDSISGSSMGAVVAKPNIGTTTIRDQLNGPRLDYTIDFKDAGNYIVWLRTKGESSQDNAVHAGIDEEILSEGGYAMGASTDGTWKWGKHVINGKSSVEFNIPSSGRYTFNLWMRKDGVVVDKIILTKNHNFIPSDLGPDWISFQGQPSFVPQNVILSNPKINNVNIQWEDTHNEKFYVIERKLDESDWDIVSILEENSTSFTDKNLQAGKKFFYRIKSGNESGYSSYSSEVSYYVPVSNGFYKEHEELVVIDLENYSYNHDGYGEAVSSYWSSFSDSVSGEVGLEALPNNNINTKDRTTGPRLDYEIDFESPGKYYVYLRISGPSNIDDTVHMGLNGDLLTAGYRGIGYFGDWYWQRYFYLTDEKIRFFIEIPSSGKHTINVWMREDGVQLDKLILAKESDLTLSGKGPDAFPHSENFPLAPENLLVTWDENLNAFLEWEDSLNESSYHLEYKSEDEPWRFLAQLPENASTFYHTNIDFEEKHSYRLKALNEVGESSYSEEAKLSYLSYYIVNSGEDIVVESENYHLNLSGIGKYDEVYWQEDTTLPDSSGSAMSPKPDLGLSTNDIFSSPRIDYRIHFPTAGNWYIYFRTQGPDDKSDSFHVGLNGSPFTLGTYGVGYYNPEWFWNRYMYSTEGEIRRISVNISTPGIHTINLWMREDGVSVDKFILSLAEDLPYKNLSSNQGPEESPMFPVEPGAPKFTVVKPTDFINNSIDLSWKNSILAKSFILERKKKGSRTWNVVISDIDASIRFYRDSNLEMNTKYRYRLKAVNKIGDSVYSKTRAAITSGFSELGFLENNGMLVIEAENFTDDRIGSGKASASYWDINYKIDGASGSAVQAIENIGINTNTDILNGPRLDYNIHFKTSGTYYVWVRTLGATNQDNAIHVGVDGNLLSEGGLAMGSSTNGEWKWGNNVIQGKDSVAFSIQEPGQHTLSVWMRKDGVNLDKIILTQDANFTPKDLSYNESETFGMESEKFFIESSNINALDFCRQGRIPQISRKLELSKSAEILKLIADHAPNQLGLDFALWDTVSVKDLIKKEYDLFLSKRKINEYLKWWGLNPTKPIKSTTNPLTRIQKKWLRKHYPILLNKSNCQNAEIYWLDINGMQKCRSHFDTSKNLDNSLDINDKSEEFTFKRISAKPDVGIGAHFLIYEDEIRPLDVIEFLEGLIKDNDKKIFLITENHKFYREKILKRWLKNHSSKLEIFFYPSDSLSKNTFGNSNWILSKDFDPRRNIKKDETLENMYFPGLSKF